MTTPDRETRAGDEPYNPKAEADRLREMLGLNDVQTVILGLALSGAYYAGKDRGVDAMRDAWLKQIKEAADAPAPR